VSYHHPICENRTEKRASATRTIKMDSTTDRVVKVPTLSAEPETCMPNLQPTIPMIMAKTGALMMPTVKELR
jgi:hypothetical protein